MELSTFCKKGTGLLLLGRPGLSMLEDALLASSKLLECSVERLNVHPDFLLICPQDGKKSIGVDAAMEIVSKGSLKPSKSSRIICVIDGIDKMTIPAQNKLLKLLEEGSTIQILAVAYTPQVLSTVKSRLRVIEYHPLNMTTFCETYPDVPDVMYYATGGCPGLLTDMHEKAEMLQNCYNIMFEGTNTACLLKELHLVKEKDKSSVTESVADMQATCRVLSAACMKILRNSNLSSEEVENYSKLLKELQFGEVASAKSTYTKDNFFQLILKCIERRNL